MLNNYKDFATWEVDLTVLSLFTINEDEKIPKPHPNHVNCLFIVAI